MRNKLYKAFEKEKTLKDWALEYNIDYNTLHKRIKYSEYNLEKALIDKVFSQEKPIECLGKIFGTLRVEEIISKKGQAKVLCTCLFNDCNNKFIARLNNIKQGRIKSCGC